VNHVSYILGLQAMKTFTETPIACASNQSIAFCGDHTGNSFVTNFACG
jgi:hypothetical protein